MSVMEPILVLEEEKAVLEKELEESTKRIKALEDFILLLEEKDERIRELETEARMMGKYLVEMEKVREYVAWKQKSGLKKGAGL